MLRGRQMLRDLAGHAEARYTSPSGKWEPQKTLERGRKVQEGPLIFIRSWPGGQRTSQGCSGQLYAILLRGQISCHLSIRKVAQVT